MPAVPVNGGGISRHAPKPSWLLGAPITKAFTTITIGSYVVSEMMGLHPYLSMDMDRILNDGEIWRVLSCQATFASIGELLFGLGIMFPLMRRFEREMGSRKFGTFFIFTSLLSMSWELLLAQIFHNTQRSSGPYHVIGSLLFLYHQYTPRLYPRFFGILGFDFSEKAFTYLFSFQLLFSGGLSTLLPAFVGIIAGFLCSSPTLPISKWELPEFFYKICGFVGAVFVERPPIVMLRRRQNAMMRGGGNRQRMIPDATFGMFHDAGRQGLNPPPFQPLPPQQQPPPPPPPPPEDVVESLTSMGFEREAVIRVLQQCDNNVEIAANRLLSE